MFVSNITDKPFCNIDFYSKSETLIEKVEKTADSLENYGFRYRNDSPANYIYFNNELWRIIGSVPTKIDENGTIQNLIKLVKNESIGKLAFDGGSTSTMTNIWGDNKLYNMLNNFYYGKSDATYEDGCLIYSNTSWSKCDYTVSGIDPAGYYGKMIKNVYWNTGGVTTDMTTADAYASETSVQTVQGYIGLMTATDYILSANHYNTALEITHPKSFNESQWIYQGDGLLMTPLSDSKKIMIIAPTGTLSNINSNYGRSIYPVLYLDPSTYIVSGNGTITNPYQLGM